MEILPRYNPKQVEPKILKSWLENGFFKAKITAKAKPFSIVIPPPNVTGILHMGHALNNTIQDVLIRYQRLKGSSVLWMPGTDHAVIATQNVVEKKLAKQGKNRKSLGRDNFLEEVWKWRDEYGTTIISQLEKLGASCDWERLRFTMDEAYSQAVTRVFVQLWRKKLIYQGNYIINWCPRCQTALSDEEAPRQEKEGFLYYIKYRLKNSDQFITVATTRPETMLGDVAVAVNPQDLRYQSFWGKTLILPLVEREVPLIKDKLVDSQFGTGAVKVTPAHDLADFQMASRCKELTPVLVMNPDATMNENAGVYQGMDRFQAREAIVESLKKLDLLEKIEPHSLAVGHCYRCNTIIEPYLSRQWFVRMKPLAKPAIKAVKKGDIKFYPQRWTKVYLNWMENIRDWCISRQIWWGHRIPVYYCRDCRKEVIASETKPEKCRFCKSTNLEQDQDVLDTWFSSWLWPFATFGWPFESSPVASCQLPVDIKKKKKEFEYFYPTSVLVTAPEIIFFWVARMIMAGFEFTGKLPFKDIYIHGTVRDKTGKKMSKSLGNTIDPLEVIEDFGADALRFSIILCAASGSDVYLSNERFLVGRNFSNKIWNAARFILLKIESLGIEIADFDFTQLADSEKWIIAELNQTVAAVSAHLDSFRLNEAAKEVYDFFWHDFCDWYIEIIKDDFSGTQAKVSLYILQESLKLLHPFMPFISEEIFGLIKKNTALTLPPALVVSAWPQCRKKIEPREIETFKALIKTVAEIRNIKAILGLSSRRLDLAIRTDSDHLQFLEANKIWLRRLTLADEVKFKDKNQGEDLTRVLYDNGLWQIDLDAGNISPESFVAVLDKKIQAKEAVAGKIKARLASQQFRKNAGSEKIAEEEFRLKDLQAELDRLEGLKDAYQ
ncbi:MAG: valine--tRNA ligase [Candidatus Omnitrophota bacterium]